jgi:hypothetical protein
LVLGGPLTDDIVVRDNLKGGRLFYFHFSVIGKSIAFLEEKQILPVLKSNGKIFGLRIDEYFFFVLTVLTIRIKPIGVGE